MKEKNKFYSLKQIRFEKDYATKKMADHVGKLKLKTLRSARVFILKISNQNQLQYKLIVV